MSKSPEDVARDVIETESPAVSKAQGCRPESVRSLRDLIVCLESANGPDRDLDLECWWWGKASQPGVPMEPAYKAHNLQMNDASRYTSSLDAAVTLVPKGMGFAFVGPWHYRDDHEDETLRGQPTYEALCTDDLYGFDIESVGDFDESGKGRTPAIALCIAALKATAQMKVGTMPRDAAGGEVPNTTTKDT